MKEIALSDQMAAVARTTARNPYGDQRYTPPEQALQTTSTPLVKAVLRRALLWWGLPTILTAVAAGANILVSSISGDEPNPAVFTLAGLFTLLAFAGFVAALVVPLREQLSEWQTLLAGRANAADSAFAAIYGVLSSRKVPAQVTPRRYRTSPTQTDNVLVVHAEGAQVFISSFAYGTGLYLGWSMWRSRYPLPIVWAAIRENLSAGAGVERGVHRTIRTSRLRALREAVAAAAAEGVDVAIAGTEVPIAATFGFDVPVVDTTASPMPPALPPAPPARPITTAKPTGLVPPAPPSRPAAPVPVPPAPPTVAVPVPPVTH